MKEIYQIHFFRKTSILFALFLFPLLAFSQVINCADITVNTSPALCPGQGTVSVILPANAGGTPPFTYSATGPSNSSNNANGTFNNVKAGTYTVTVTDALGETCVKTCTVANAYTDMSPIQLSSTNCLLTSNFTGGKGPYTYKLYNSYPLTPAGLLNTFTSTSTTATYPNLNNNTSYWVEVTDACSEKSTSSNGLIQYIPLGLTNVMTATPPSYQLSSTVTSPFNL